MLNSAEVFKIHVLVIDGNEFIHTGKAVYKSIFELHDQYHIAKYHCIEIPASILPTFVNNAALISCDIA